MDYRHALLRERNSFADALQVEDVGDKPWANLHGNIRNKGEHSSVLRLTLIRSIK